MVEQRLVTLLEVSVTTGAVILMFSLFSRLLNRRYQAKWKYWVWLVLGIRLLIPYQFSLVRPPVSVTVPNRPLAPSAASPLGATGMQATGVPPPLEAVQAQGEVTFLQILMLLWLAGFLLFLVFHLAGNALFQKNARRWSKRVMDPELLRQFEGTCAQLRLRRKPAFRISARVQCPLVVGLIRPVLYLPDEQYTPGEARLILRHELIHCRRHDLWYKLLFVFINAVHWFNPAAYLLRRLSGQDLEIFCDDAVTSGISPEEKRRYSEAIFAGAKCANAHHLALTTQFNGGVNDLKERFSNILGKQKKRNGVLLLVVALLALLLVGGLVGCSVGADESNNTNTDPSNAESQNVESQNAESQNAGEPAGQTKTQSTQRDAGQSEAQSTKSAANKSSTKSAANQSSAQNTAAAQKALENYLTLRGRLAAGPQTFLSTLLQVSERELEKNYIRESTPDGDYSLNAPEDNWFVTDISYQTYLNRMQAYMTKDVAEKFTEYIKNENGKVCYFNGGGSGMSYKIQSCAFIEQKNGKEYYTAVYTTSGDRSTGRFGIQKVNGKYVIADVSGLF